MNSRFVYTKMNDGAYDLRKAHHSDAGYDLTAAMKTRICVGQTTMINTCVKVALPDGHVGMVCSRSGMAMRHSIIVLNAPGIIDAGYRGEIKVLLHNLGRAVYDIEPGMRIAQLLIVPLYGHNHAHEGGYDPRCVDHGYFEEHYESDRGAAGLGSTGTQSLGEPRVYGSVIPHPGHVGADEEESE